MARARRSASRPALTATLIANVFYLTMQFYYFYGLVLIVAGRLGAGGRAGAARRGMTDVSVVIVSYESRALLARCLAALAADAGRTATLRGDRRRPGLARTARRPGWRPSIPRCGSSRSPENVGFGAGNNRGAALASGRWLLLLNSDAFVRPGAIDELVRFARVAAAPRASSGPRLLWPDGRLQRSCRRFPTVFRLATEYLYLRKLAPRSRILNGFYYGEFAHDEAWRVDWVTGACVLVRRELFEQLGGFDEAFFLYSEEVDLIYRARQLGAETWYDPAAEVEHEWGGTAGRSSALTLEEQARGHVRYLDKHASRATAKRARSVLLAGLRLRARRSGAYREAARWLARAARGAAARGDAPAARGPAVAAPRPATTGGSRLYPGSVLVLKVIFWFSLAALVWTHALYPLFVAALARLRPRPARSDESFRPRVALVIAAYNEDDVIERKLENALALDYPRDRLRILVASDASSDGTDEIVRGFADRGVELVRAPRGGKVNAQNHTVRTLTDVDVVAFSDANCEWAPDALQQLVAPLADPRVAYVCGRLQLRSPEGTNQEGAYWRYEIWLRARESLVHSVTGGNGSIYAVRRERYEEVDPRFGHDLSFPYLMVKRGFRAVYAPRAVALEKMTTDLSDEFRRKVRMFGHCWLLVLHGRMFGLRALGPLYWVEMISHRLLRYASGILHLALLVTSIVLAFSAGGVYAVVLGLHVVFALCVLASMALRGRVRVLALAEYYFLITLATLLALGDVGRGVPAVWERAEGTR